MEVTSLCLIISATLSLHPDRSQFFRYERFMLSCAAPGSNSSWTVKRNTSSKTSQPCMDFGKPHKSSCNVSDVYPQDSGPYWCESERGECRNVINIAVTAGEVILESPALPVTAGDHVTLRCSTRKRFEKLSTSDFSAVFYKDDVFIGNVAKGEMILESVSSSDEGLYRCEHPTRGRSEQSWLAVRAPPSPPPLPPLMSLPNLIFIVLLFILYTIILIIGIHVYRRWARARADAEITASDQLVQE